MQPPYDLTSTGQLDPTIVQLDDDVDNLFPVPRDNAVGTNDINNAITLFGFKGNKALTYEVARDFFKYVSGGELSYLPIFDPNVIGYAQTRRFVMVNLKSGKASQHRICYPLEETILKVAVADGAKRHFIFSIEKFAKDAVRSSDYTRQLRLMDLSGKEPLQIKDRDLPKTVGWFVAHGKIFLYDKKIDVYGPTFEPSRHPMVEVYNRHSDKLDPFRIHPHPHLPFAVIVDQNLPTMIIAWDETRKDQLVSMIRGETQSFEFSPDGKWVIFKDEKSLGTFRFYLMPVSEKYPHYLGSPILLRKGNFLTTCWTTNPISFVGSTGSKLYRWELTRQAYPQAGDQDLHDYIVEQDLKRLKADEK